MKNVKQYYKELGKLVYSVAMADGIVQPEERVKLHQFVLKEMAAKEPTSDSSGMNQAFYIDFEFEAMEEKQPPIDDLIRSYTRYVHANYEPGDTKLIQNSIDLLEAVSLAFTEKKEKQIIEKVKNEFSEISKDIFNAIQ
jgi:hypothetical protein